MNGTRSRIRAVFVAAVGTACAFGCMSSNGAPAGGGGAGGTADSGTGGATTDSGTGGTGAQSAGGTAGCDDGKLFVPSKDCIGDDGSAGACGSCDVPAKYCDAGPDSQRAAGMCTWVQAEVNLPVAANYICCATDPVPQACDPTQARTCLDQVLARACRRPPICLPDGGVWGCDDVAAACPAVTANACHQVFDGLTYKRRVFVHDCFTSGSSDAGSCATRFSNCVFDGLP